MQEKIILLHGALGSKQQFKVLKELLTDHFEIYDFSFEGHGGVPSDQAFSIDLFTENTINFLNKNELKKVNIFGYSMGGYVAINLAQKHPELVQKIVTLGTKFNWSEEAAAQEVKMLNPDKIEAKVPAFAKALDTIHTPNDWKEVVRKTAAMMLDLAAGKKLNPQSFQQIDQEILIGIGALDKMVSIEESENAANYLKHGQLKVIADFQHPIERVDAGQLAKIIVDFI